jgi:hypothetical protein
MERLFSIECILILIILYAFFKVVSFLQIRYGEKKYQPLINFVFILVGWYAHLLWFSVYYYIGNYFMYMFYIFLVGTDSKFFQKSTKQKALLFTVVISVAVGLLASTLTYPIFQQLENWNIIYKIILVPDFSIPFFYLLIPTLSITSGVFCYFWIYYLDLIKIQFFNSKEIYNIEQSYKTVLAYLQLVVLGILPLLIVQIFFGSALLEEVTLKLYVLIITQLYFVIFCISIVFLNSLIFNKSFLRINSVFALISVISTLSAVIQFIVFQIDSGTYYMAVIISSIFGSAIGAYFSRVTLSSSSLKIG